MSKFTNESDIFGFCCEMIATTEPQETEPFTIDCKRGVNIAGRTPENNAVLHFLMRRNSSSAQSIIEK